MDSPIYEGHNDLTSPILNIFLKSFFIEKCFSFKINLFLFNLKVRIYPILLYKSLLRLTITMQHLFYYCFFYLFFLINNFFIFFQFKSKKFNKFLLLLVRFLAVYQIKSHAPPFKNFIYHFLLGSILRSYFQGGIFSRLLIYFIYIISIVDCIN